MSNLGLKKQTAFFLVFMVLFISFVYSAPTDEQIRQAATTLGVPFTDLKSFVQSYQVQNIPGAITITARDLSAIYKENEIKADSLYKNKTVKITGIVEKIEKDWEGYYYIVLEGGNWYSVYVYINTSELTRAANLKKGQTVTLIGTCIGVDTVYPEIVQANFSM